MSNIIIRFTPTKRDFLWISYAGLRSRPVVLMMSLGFFVVLPWLAALAIIVTGKELNGSFLTLLLLPPVTVVFFAILPLLIFSNSPALNGEHTYEFSNAEIHLYGPGFDNRVQWSLVTSCIEVGGGLLFSSNKLAIISLPPRTLSVCTINSLCQLLENNGVKYKGTIRGTV